MPIYEFNCKDCQKDFREFASVSEKKSGDIKCPHCESINLQEKYSMNSGKGSKDCSSCSGGSCSSCG